MSLQELDNMGWNGEIAERTGRLERGTYRGAIEDYKLAQVGKNNTWVLKALITVYLPDENSGAQVEKTWYLTPKSMPYVARDLQELESPINNSSPLSGQFQNLSLVGKSVDFRYDIPKDKEYSEVIWLRLAENSATTPQGAGDGIRQSQPSAKTHRYANADRPEKHFDAAPPADDDIPF